MSIHRAPCRAPCLVACLACLVAGALAQDPPQPEEMPGPIPVPGKILDRVPELQRVAQQANAGARGCGVGEVTFATSRGDRTVVTGRDAAVVFGDTVSMTDIHVLLRARAEHVRAGKGAMSGEVSDLCYVALRAVAEARDPESIAPAAGLLGDPDDTVRGWAAIALIRLGEADPTLRESIRLVDFPEAALSSAQGRGVEAPDWLGD